MWKYFLNLGVFLCLSSLILGQSTPKKLDNKGTYTGVAHFGICTSQINGDGFGGYNKFSINAGLGTYTPINDKLKLQIELNYGERGSRKRINDPGSKPVIKFDVHYIDVPLLIKFSTWKFEFEAGICNGIYLWHTEQLVYNYNSPKYALLWKFNRYECAAKLGVYVPISDKWIGNVRFHYSLYPAAGGIGHFNGSYFISGLYNNAITFSFYRLFMSH